MIRVCPNPDVWHNIYKRLIELCNGDKTNQSKVPIPLILNGWAYSNDTQKKERWEQTVEWAKREGYSDLITQIPDDDYLYVDEVSTYQIGPLGGPMYRLWDFEPKFRPTNEELVRFLKRLKKDWPSIAGERMSAITEPTKFTGRKARRLLVRVTSDGEPPWGGWHSRSNISVQRLAFTKFRRQVNAALKPHEVDHMDFIQTCG